MFVSFHILFLVSFGNEVTKISCHFQAKTVQLIFLFLVILTKIRKTKNGMNRTLKVKYSSKSTLNPFWLVSQLLLALLNRISLLLPSFWQEKRGGNEYFTDYCITYSLHLHLCINIYIHSYVHILLSWHEKSKVLV